MEWPHEAAVEVEGWLVRWKPHFENFGELSTLRVYCAAQARRNYDG
jgi:hypothetical protein